MKKNQEADNNTRAANTIGNRPETGSSENKPMQNKTDVEKSNDENINKDFPGYPYYPASEDIMHPQNHTERVTAELDNASEKDLNRMQLDNPVDKTNPYSDNEKDDLGIVPGTEADVTKDDLIALGSRDRDMDMGEDEERLPDHIGSGGAFEGTEAITERDLEVNDDGVDKHLARTGEDLDIPEMTDATNTEALGQDDEENSYYSLGGDEKESNEDDNRNNY